MKLTTKNSIDCDSVENYLNIVLKGTNNNSLFYRGESRKHDYVIPNLYLNSELTLKTSEGYYRSLFSQLGHDDYSDSTSLFRVISEFQHYGAKTRILDITTNPLVALYFAVEKFHGEKVPDISGVFYPCEDGIVYLFDSIPRYKKYDTGHTVAVKSALNLMPQEYINAFIWVCEIIKEKWDKEWNSLKYHQLDYAADEAKRRKLYNISTRDYYVIGKFMNLLNQRAKSREKLVYPFEIFEDLCNSHIVIPSKCTDRIKQQQGAFIFPRYINTACKELNEIQSEIDESICLLSAYIDSPIEGESICAIRIPGGSKWKIKRDLTKLGITEGFIYPEIQHRSNTLLEALRD